MASGDTGSDSEPIDEAVMEEHHVIQQSRNLYDLGEWDVDCETIDFTQCRVDTIPDFSRFTQLKEIGLRQNLLTSINPRITVVGLIRLDLYDNQIEVISNLDELVNLEYLDMSYNRIKKIEGLSGLVNLRRLYLVHNKIDEIAGLESLTKLELLELGDNRIKASIQNGLDSLDVLLQLENIGHLIDLRELYIGKNKIRKLENLENLKKLTVLSVPGNRITELSGISQLTELSELHISDQGIQSLAELIHLKKLTIIDAGNNKITNLDGLNHLEELTDLWMNNNEVSDWNELLKLSNMPALRTIYLEWNPIHTNDRSNYRRKMMLSLPQVTQIDATLCR